MLQIPRPHDIYRHFKGNLYQIVALAEHSETGEQLVVYQALYGDFKIYARPLAMFMEKVDRVKYPDAVQEYRFEPHIQQEVAQSAAVATFAQAEPAQAAPDQAASAQAVSAQTEPTQTETLQSVPAQTAPDLEEELEFIDPLVLEFLEADSYEERLNILAALHHRITDDMITTMAVASDVEVPDGDVEERYEGLKNCLIMLEKYECNRLR